MQILSVPRFERLFRRAAGLDVDKTDLKRYSDFLNRKIYDILIRAQATAKANGRDVIDPFDLPIPKGLQESIHEFTPALDELFEAAMDLMHELVPGVARGAPSAEEAVL
jgi:Domain of unknown function (DUF1931)